MKSVTSKDLNFSPEESKEIVELLARKRCIKDFESMSEGRLLDAIISSKLLEKSKKSKLSKAIIETIEREFNKQRPKFSKSKIKDIRKNIYEVKNRKNLFTLGTKKIEKALDELEDFFF